MYIVFPGSSDSKESACNSGDLGSIPGLGRSSGEGKGYPHQYSGLENSVDCIVHGVAKSQTRLSKFHFHFSLSSWKAASPALRFGEDAFSLSLRFGEDVFSLSV